MSRCGRLLAALLLAAFLCAQASCGSPAARSPVPSKSAAVSVQPSDASASPAAGATSANPSAPPGATPSASNPKHTAKTGGFTLCLFSPSFYQEQRDEIYRVQTALNENGWRVSFMLESYGEEISYSQESSTIHQLIAKRAASGDAVADGFIVPAGMAGALVAEGLAQDAGDTLRKTTPALYALFQGLFESSTSGIPVYMNCQPGGGPMSLVLKEEYASRLKLQVNGTDDLLKLEDNLGNEKLFMYSRVIYDIWAYQQGYYSLARYRIEGLYYAAYTDEKCTPVPLESIPGFRDFHEKYYRLYKSVGYGGSTDQPRFAGYIYMLSKSFPYLSPAVPQRYVAFPLGYTPRIMPDDAPRVSREIAVSAKSYKAADIARCMEWIFTSQENYDAIQYGKQGKDYRITGNRLEMLNNGYPVAFDSERYTRHLPLFFFDSMERVTAQAPLNFEEAVASCRHRPEPMEGIVTRSGYDEAMQAFTDSKSDFISKRYEILSSIEQNETFGSIKTADEFVTGVMKRLDTIRGETEALADEYGKLIQQMR